MRKFSNYIKNAWLIVPSNTQLCERWVKDSNECIVTGRSERLTQQVALCCSMTVMDYYSVANLIYEEKDRKGNKFYTSGIVGSRIDKDSGEVEDQKKSRLPEGKLILETMLDGISKFDKEMEEINVSAGVAKKIMSHLCDEKEQFEYHL